MSVKIITDSGSDFSIEEAENLGIGMVPLIVSFEDEEYRDAYDLTHEQFFEKLIETDIFPKTSQVTPYTYSEEFKKYQGEGEEVVCICLSSRLSGCYLSAVIASDEFKNVYVVDSLNACVGQRILVELAVRYANEGLDAKTIAEKLEEEKKKIKLIALIDTLEYLKKGGRISTTVAIAGTLLSIKPVIAVEDGEINLIGKARGSKNGNNMLKEFIGKAGEIDFDKPICLAYSGLSTQFLDKYVKDSADLYAGHEDCLRTSSIGAAIGTHIGPGAIGLTFFVK